jgi:hypothetical protein
MLERQPDDSLAVGVQDRDRHGPAPQPGDREQHAFLEHRREPVAQRPVRQRGDADRGRVRHVGAPHRHPRLVEREPAACRAPRRPLGAQPGVAQPGVERVEQDAVGCLGATDVERQAPGQQREHRRLVDVVGELELERRGRHRRPGVSHSRIGHAIWAARSHPRW